MTKDFIIGLLLGVLVGLFVIWLFDRKPDDTPPKKTAAQPVGSNILGLDEQLEGTG